MRTIDELNSFDKAREKLAIKGVQSLKRYELLAILLGSGTKDKDVLQLSHKTNPKSTKRFPPPYANERTGECEMKNVINNENLVEELKNLIASKKEQVAVSVNASLTLMYWHVGFKINILQTLSAKLSLFYVVKLKYQEKK